MSTRQEQLLDKMGKDNIEAMLITLPENVRYLSSFTGGDSYLLFLRDKLFFVTDFRYQEQAVNECGEFELSVMSKEDKNLIGKVAAIILENNINSYDGVLLDALFFEKRDQIEGSEDLKGLRNAVDKLNQLKHIKTLPFFILSGQTKFEKDSFSPSSTFIRRTP